MKFLMSGHSAIEAESLLFSIHAMATYTQHRAILKLVTQLSLPNPAIAR